MSARNDVKRLFNRSSDAKLMLAAAQLRFAAWVDALAAHWLARCAARAEAGQWLFKADPQAHIRVQNAGEPGRSVVTLG